jgi:hypothetical protein
MQACNFTFLKVTYARYHFYNTATKEKELTLTAKDAMSDLHDAPIERKNDSTVFST